jgi:hypothetical protein
LASTTVRTQRPRIKPSVALVILEVLKEQDRPTEILEDENPTHTLPRRLGLSGVVDAQIRRYREDVKGKRKLGDEELNDLFALVLRRPDASRIFFLAGARVLGEDLKPPALSRLAPRALKMRRAKREVKRTFHRLFGRKMGAFAPGGFVLEGAGLFFFQTDARGHACNFVTSLCEGVLRRHFGRTARVSHALCQSRGDSTCRWVGDPAGGAPSPESTGEKERTS